MGTRQRPIVLCPLLASLLALTAWAAAAGPKTQPSTKPAGQKPRGEFPLARAIKQPIPKYTLEQLARRFPAFQHEPFETAGFNHFTLPFLYESLDGTGDRHEAYAFSFLLSASLDWAPGCYCTRHAYFAFKRARKYVLKLTKEYDVALIRWAIKDWEATHAVGGKLVRSKAGYAGRLVIFNAAGRRVVEKEYKDPRGFFGLLGDMCVDAMKFFGCEPSPALVKHLHLKRCKHPQSIIDLGKAAFVKEKSDEEFAIYKKILMRDPGFADVRYWWANQRYWRSDDRRHYAYQMALAMDSYLIEAILSDFDPTECPSKELAAKHPQWMQRAQELVGPDFSGLLKVRITEARKRGRVSPELLDLATKVAARYPNDYWFLFQLARLYNQGGELPVDPAMSISISLAALRNRYLTSLGHKRDAAENLTTYLDDLGYNGIIAQIAIPVFRERLESGQKDEAAWCAVQVARALAEMGQYGDAVKWYRFAFRNQEPTHPQRNRLLVEAACTAGLGGETRILDQILHDHREKLDETNMTFLVRAYQDLWAGRKRDPKRVESQSRHKRGWWDFNQELLLYGQLDLANGQEKYYRPSTIRFRQFPGWRRNWILLDAYDRAKPRSHIAGFYEAINWLHGDDPWVRKAVADFRQRAKGRKQLDPLSPRQLLERLSDFSPVRWPVPNPAMARKANATFLSLPPGSATAAIRALAKTREFRTAEELALRYHHLAVDYGDYHARAHANHLIHRAEEARRRAKEQAKHDDL